MPRDSSTGFHYSPQISQNPLSQMQILSLTLLSLHNAGAVLTRCLGVFLHLQPHAPPPQLWLTGPTLLLPCLSLKFWSPSSADPRSKSALPIGISSVFTLFWKIFLTAPFWPLSLRPYSGLLCPMCLFTSSGCVPLSERLRLSAVAGYSSFSSAKL